MIPKETHTDIEKNINCAIELMESETPSPFNLLSLINSLNDYIKTREQLEHYKEALSYAKQIIMQKCYYISESTEFCRDLDRMKEGKR